MTTHTKKLLIKLRGLSDRLKVTNDSARMWKRQAESAQARLTGKVAEAERVQRKLNMREDELAELKSILKRVARVAGAGAVDAE